MVGFHDILVPDECACRDLDGLRERLSRHQLDVDDPMFFRVMDRQQDMLFLQQWRDFGCKEGGQDSCIPIVDGADISEQPQIQGSY